MRALHIRAPVCESIIHDHRGQRDISLVFSDLPGNPVVVFLGDALILDEDCQDAQQHEREHARHCHRILVQSLQAHFKLGRQGSPIAEIHFLLNLLRSPSIPLVP